MLTVSWVRFSPMAVILMVRVPNLPSRPKTISIPSVRRKVWPGAAGQGFAVTVDEVGKTGAIACVKEPGGRCDIEEDVGAAHGTGPSSARLMTT